MSETLHQAKTPSGQPPEGTGGAPDPATPDPATPDPATPVTGDDAHDPATDVVPPGPLRVRVGLPHRTLMRDIMHSPVVAIDPRADFSTAVAAVHEHHHDVLPVVDSQHRVMGVLCASDLLAKVAVQALPPRSLPLESHATHTLRRRADAVTAGELMTTPALTVSEDTTLAEAALTAVRHRLHHLPVVDERRRLVGMVCLCDLLDVLRRDDEAIVAEVRSVALAPDSGVVAASLDVRSEHGRVVLDARVTRRSQARRLRERVREVEGVVDVREHLRWDIDDVVPAWVES